MFERLAESKVSYFDLIGIEHDVGWLDVPMEDVVLVQKGKSAQELSEVFEGFFFW